jgi:hypothetical protein
LRPRAPVDALTFADEDVRRSWIEEKGMRVFWMVTMDHDWKAEGWEDARRRALVRGLAATPQQRLAWLEGAIRIAWATGALPKKRSDAEVPVSLRGERTSLEPR